MPSFSQPAVPRILLVDDSEFMHRCVSVALETLADWEVVPVFSGAEALEQLAHDRFDAALVDVEMPELDGPATVRALRATPEGAALPLLFLTGHAGTSERAHLESLDIDGIVPKPFKPPALAGLIAEQLGWDV